MSRVHLRRAHSGSTLVHWSYCEGGYCECSYCEGSLSDCTAREGSRGVAGPGAWFLISVVRRRRTPQFLAVKVVLRGDDFLKVVLGIDDFLKVVGSVE